MYTDYDVPAKIAITCGLVLVVAFTALVVYAVSLVILG